MPKIYIRAFARFNTWYTNLPAVVLKKSSHATDSNEKNHRLSIKVPDTFSCPLGLRERKQNSRRSRSTLSLTPEKKINEIYRTGVARPKDTIIGRASQRRLALQEQPVLPHSIFHGHLVLPRPAFSSWIFFQQKPVLPHSICYGHLVLPRPTFS